VQDLLRYLKQHAGSIDRSSFVIFDAKQTSEAMAREKSKQSKQGAKDL